MTSTYKDFFGFTNIGDKVNTTRQNLVNDVFSSVASKYDVMNDAMSMGIHRLWKHNFVKSLPIYSQDSHIIDMAAGTGDISLLLKKQHNVAVTMADINADMLAEGQKNLLDKGYVMENYVTTNAEKQSLLIISLMVMLSLLGCVMLVILIKRLMRLSVSSSLVVFSACLEFSMPSLPWLAKLYDLYSFNLIPFLGEIISNDRESYQYLVESIRKFPAPERLSFMLERAGFMRISYDSYSGGIVRVHKGYKKE